MKSSRHVFEPQGVRADAADIRRGSSTVAATGLLRQRAKRAGLELRPVDSDRVDERIGTESRVDRIGKVRLARDVAAVGDEEDHAPAGLLATELPGGGDDRIEERGAGLRIDLRPASA
jgi:hypothetical protein